VVQEHRLWFSTEPGAQLSTTRATVVGDIAAPPSTPRLYPSRAVRPRRSTLWKAAGGMLADHPLFGVGPDNFRLRYGSYAGLANADQRIHSNNMYLELLAGGGLIAGGVCVYFLWRATRLSVVDAWHARGTGLAAGIAAAWIAVLVHGIVDSFLTFTSIYLMVAIVLGFASAIRSQETVADANRV
jgi:O-antigen ligase